MRPRRVPIRTCVACRTTDAKRALLRVVRQPDGTVCYDAKGKMSGRGAYVCARVECIEQARKHKKLERSLKVERIAPELFQELLQMVSQNNTNAPAEPPPAQ
ncbi:predicted nucleic-acid-binding protein implicated in transcription termination [Chthonomonas calidirosea]|uniref:RNase P modulator RnpM n=1 Tax=Chthonomonas calidirosea TaxID=454171 RepID=UPI0006DD4B42|nr:YlxR family protein [Chthonomonas calidirosea]CEK20131.1 predicted nucleic-acid-binding protein implicated in transcription termination [Chthonomonas calidirosea]